MLDKVLQEYGGAQIVGANVTLNFIHGLPDAHFGRFVKNRIDAVQCALNHRRIAHVAVNELSSRINVLTCVFAMNLRHQQIQHPHLMAALDQRICEMRANEAGAAGNQYV